MTQRWIFRDKFLCHETEFRSRCCSRCLLLHVLPVTLCGLTGREVVTANHRSQIRSPWPSNKVATITRAPPLYVQAHKERLRVQPRFIFSLARHAVLIQEMLIVSSHLSLTGLHFQVGSRHRHSCYHRCAPYTGILISLRIRA
jgi:hypothetical protein